MPTSLTLDTDRGHDGELVLTATGEIDLSNVDAFDRALSAAANEAAAGEQELTVDLSAVEYLDSAAINALFTHADRICIIAHPLLMSILSMCGLTELINTEPASAGH